jgi:dCMP deaminase
MRIEKPRISWDNIFLLEAKLWSSRSHDPQTQCGCVLVSPDRTVLSTGYNGFIRDINDTALPNLRPATQDQEISKYDFMIHAEHNAILNCARNGTTTVGATAYITGPPCNWCLQYMWQAAIVKIVYSDWSNPTMIEGDKHKKVQQALLELMNPYFYEFDSGYDRMKMEFVSSADIEKEMLINEFGVDKKENEKQ